MENISVDINYLIKEYQGEISKLQGELLMLRALVAQLQDANEQNEQHEELDEEQAKG